MMAAWTAFAMTPLMGTPLVYWLGFLLLVLVLLVLDLGVLNRRLREINLRESLLLSAGYMAVALTFAGWLAWAQGREPALEFVTAYLVEQSLSLDNLFVMAVIFSYFGIPREYQHRVLFYGVMGVIVLRAVMIGLGAVLLHRFEWLLYGFAAFLLLTGLKMWWRQEDDAAPDLATNPLLRWLRRRLPLTEQLHAQHFWVKQSPGPGLPARWQATPLFLALIVIELADLMFAVDSVPAVFSVSQDTFVVYTSNIFAILGLRSLYFALAALLHRFIYLQQALALVLIFIGGKVLLAPWLGKLPALASLLVTVLVLAAGMLLSWWKTRRRA